MRLPLEERGPIAWMARNRVAANLLMFTLLIGGVLTAFRIKQEVFPEFDLDRILITVPYPGASPDEVEKSIVKAIEEEVNGLDGVKEVTSAALEGVGSVDVELLLGANRNRLLTDIKNAVDRITSFPEESERPTVSLLSTRQQAISLIVHGEQDEAVLRETAERVRDELLQDPGITLVELSGVRRPEIAIEVPQANLRAYNLTLGDVARQVAVGALESPGGGVKTPGGEILLRTTERRDLGREFEDIPLLTTADGAQVTVADIATIKDSFEDTDEAAFFNGRPAVMIDVYRVGDQTPIEVARIVTQYTEDARDRMPPGVEVSVWRDWSEIYRGRMSLLLRNAGIGLVLVLLTLGLFLEVRLAFWVTMGIPVSFLGAILLQPAMDVSINMISLFAFIMALGIVVDDAIVVGENIYEFRLKEESFLRAAIFGARQVAMPVVFAVLTNIAAFMPLFFVTGMMGKFFRVIPAIVVGVFAISLVECLFILPAHLGHQRRKGRPTGPRGAGRLLAWGVRTVYRPVVHAALKYRYLTVVFGLAVLGVTAAFIHGGHIEQTHMPRVESDFCYANASLSYGAPVEQTTAVKDKLVDALNETIEEIGGKKLVRGIYARVGGLSAGRHGGGGPSGAASHETTVQVALVPKKKRGSVSVGKLAEKWREHAGELPFHVESLTFKYNIGGSRGSAISIQLSHPDQHLLEQAAQDLARGLAGFRDEGVTDIDDDVTPGKPQLDITLRPEAHSVGLRSADIARQVRHAFYGAEALRQQRGRDEIKVMVRLPREERISQYDVDELIIRTPDGGEIPLLEAAEVRGTHAYTRIERSGGRRVLNVTAEVVPGKGNAEEILNKLDADFMPELLARYPRLRYLFKGERSERQESMQSLGAGFAIALLAIFLMLAIPLRSYVQPLIVMAAIPFGIVGAVAGHVVMGLTLSLISMMGIVALSGVVVNDSLVLIHATNRRRDEGALPFDAVASAGARRFRPIILTSLTTFFGLAPMIFETSVQARFLVPMAVALGFGVLFATGVTLLLVPALYLIVEDFRRLRDLLIGVEPEPAPDDQPARSDDPA